MPDIGDALKTLYQKFVMRDILSFITPGAVFVISALYFYAWDVEKILYISKEIPFLLYLTLFGVFYAVGFFFQSLGAYILKIMPLHNRKKDGKRDDGEHLKIIKEFNDKTKENEEAKGQQEYFIVLKQMCGNNAIAMLFSGLLIFIKFSMESRISWNVFLLFVATLLVIACLYKAYQNQLNQQEKWEDLYIE